MKMTGIHTSMLGLVFLLSYATVDADLTFVGICPKCGAKTNYSVNDSGPTIIYKTCGDCGPVQPVQEIA